MFSAARTDKRVTKEVAEANHAEEGMGRYNKSILAKGALESLKRLAGEIRAEHYRRTLPWSDDGARILTAAGYEAYAAYMRQKRDEWETAVDKFLNNYPTYREEARAKLGSLYDDADYPSTREVERRFEYRWKVRPVPAAADFRVSLSAGEVDTIKAQLEDEIRATAHAAQQDMYSRIKEPVARMVERLKAYDPSQPKAAPFRDSLVSNITDLLEVLPSLDLTQDPALPAMMRELRALAAASPQELRDNMFTRSDTLARAEEMLSKVSAFMA